MSVEFSKKADFRTIKIKVFFFSWSGAFRSRNNYHTYERKTASNKTKLKLSPHASTTLTNAPRNENTNGIKSEN